MDIDNLIHMANRIGEFFQAMPDHDEAVDGVTQHLRKFWEPRMRRELLAHLDRAGGSGVHPLVVDAATQLRQPVSS